MWCPAKSSPGICADKYKNFRENISFDEDSLPKTREKRKNMSYTLIIQQLIVHFVRTVFSMAGPRDGLLLCLS